MSRRPARDRTPDEHEVRAGPRARRSECGGDRPSRGFVRSRDLRIRRLDLVRPVQMDPRGRPAPSTEQRAPLPAQLHALDALHARRGEGPRAFAAPAARPAPNGLARRAGDRIPSRALRPHPTASELGVRDPRSRRDLRARGRGRSSLLRRVHVGRVGAEVALRGNVARGETRLDRGLVRAPAARGGPDHARATRTARFPTGRSEGWDLGDEIVTQADFAAELVGNAGPCLFVDRRTWSERDPAICEADSGRGEVFRKSGCAMPDGPALDEAEANPRRGTAETGRPVLDAVTQGAATVHPVCIPDLEGPAE